MRQIDSQSPITVGLSGGVDSAVSAYLLQKAGYRINAIFMKNWEEDSPNCPASKDFEDAQAICERLKIDCQLVNFSAEYWTHVFSYFLNEYQAGRTPNPDVICNQEIKFKAFLNYAQQKGATFIATGHYARLENCSDGVRLLKSQDTDKDQTYFLYRLNQTQLKSSLFPIGHLTKKEVRQIAERALFKNYNKKDSTGICFIGERRFKDFLQQFLPAQPGAIQTLEGETIGQHDGLMFYTIGQRQGLKIGGKRDKLTAPWYVVEKDLKQNVLKVVQSQHHPALFQKKLRVKDLHWILAQPSQSANLTAKIRYRQQEQACTLSFANDATWVEFLEPQRAVTPGQSIVFYQGDICLGGGIIDIDS